jgi:hypothetical protein
VVTARVHWALGLSWHRNENGHKLLPFQPEKLEPTEYPPNTALQLPENRVKWINFTMPSFESIKKAMYEIAKAEIGAAVNRVPLFLANNC